MMGTLFDAPPTCTYCRDTGWVQHPRGGVVICKHCKPETMKALGSVAERAIKQLRGERYDGAAGELKEDERRVADLIHGRRAANPIKIKEITAETGYDERKVKAVCRTLRNYHLLPIGASRREPAGIFWISTAEEFMAYYHTTKAQALDELQTLGRLCRRHFPELAGQLKLEF